MLLLYILDNPDLWHGIDWQFHPRMGSMVGGEGRRDFEPRFIVTDLADEGPFFNPSATPPLGTLIDCRRIVVQPPPRGSISFTLI